MVIIHLKNFKIQPGIKIKKNFCNFVTFSQKQTTHHKTACAIQELEVRLDFPIKQKG